MKTLERDILLSLLAEEQSIYRLERSLKKYNYATVWRHIEPMQNDGLVKTSYVLRKNGEIDGRDTQVLSLTNKGLATLLIDGDLNDDGMITVGRRVLDLDEKKLKKPMEGWLKQLSLETFKEAYLAVRPKVNLKYFDEKWFREIFFDTYMEVTAKVIEKHKERLEKEGIWETDEEQSKRVKELMRTLFESGDFKPRKRGLL